MPSRFQRIAFSNILLTWDEPSHKIEAHLKQTGEKLNGYEPSEVSVIFDDLEMADKMLTKTDLEYQEWQVLVREKAQIEHALLERLRKAYLGKES